MLGVYIYRSSTIVQALTPSELDGICQRHNRQTQSFMIALVELFYRVCRRSSSLKPKFFFGSFWGNATVGHLRPRE